MQGLELWEPLEQRGLVNLLREELVLVEHLPEMEVERSRCSPRGECRTLLLEPELELAIRALDILVMAVFPLLEGLRIAVEATDGRIPEVLGLAEDLVDLDGLRVRGAVEAVLLAEVGEASQCLADNHIAVDDVREIHQRVLVLQRRLGIKPRALVPGAINFLAVIHLGFVLCTCVLAEHPQGRPQASDGPVGHDGARHPGQR
mmetsp:Transcript_37406/g.116509  ORF Transcript_37406/g.116509 Transcript_37406/m.116509 type:complete len:203 (+) Transcript_37406:131-739(+)